MTTALETVAGVGSMTSVKRGLKTLLLGEAFREKLRDLEVAFADGLNVPPLKSVSRAERKFLPAEMPYAELVGVQADPLSDNSPWSQSLAHLVVVRIFVCGDDEERITDHVERYLLAVRQLFTVASGDEMRLFPYLGGSSVPGREDYDPIAKAGDSTLVKAGTIELTVYTTS